MNIDFNADYILENERALLRPLQESDIDHLADFSTKEPGLWKYSLQPIRGKDDLELYIKTAVECRRQEREYPFIVFDKKAGEYAGCTRFYDIQPQFDSLQLGYTWYGTGYQRTGLNRHCKLLLLTFAFEKLGVVRVEFRADHDNARSIAAMRAIGCRVEGVLRSHLPKPGGGRRNSIVLSILKDEWFNGVKAGLLQKLSW